MINKSKNISTPTDNKNTSKDLSITENHISVGTVIPSPNSVSDKTNQPKKYYRKPNFFKFENVKDELIQRLDGTETSKEIAKTLHLSISTFYKYKALADALTSPQQNLMTLEEKIYKDRHRQNPIRKTKAAK